MYSIVMPDLGAIAEDATLVKWLVGEGDRVEVGQPIFEIETDKATIEVEAVRSGRVVRLLATDGQVITVGATIAEMEIEDS